MALARRERSLTADQGARDGSGTRVASLSPPNRPKSRRDGSRESGAAQDQDLNGNSRASVLTSFLADATVSVRYPHARFTAQSKPCCGSRVIAASPAEAEFFVLADADGVGRCSPTWRSGASPPAGVSGHLHGDWGDGPRRGGQRRAPKKGAKG